MRPPSKLHCVIPRSSSVSPTPTTTKLFARSPLPTSSAYTSSLQNHTQTRQLHRLVFGTCTSCHPRRTLPISTPNVRSSRAAQSPKSPTTALFQTTPFSTSSITMSSDDAYMSFLDKANADLNAGRPQQQGVSETARTETVDANTQIPASLQSVDAYYISDADEPFEPVALRWDGASKGDWPSAGT